MPGGDGPDARVETLYRRMFHTLYAYALRGMSDPSLAEEAVQDTFRVACEREDKLFASDNPEGWLMNVLKNVIRSTRRERARLAETVLEVLDENGGAADVELDLEPRRSWASPWRPARSGCSGPGSGSRSGCGRTLSRDGGFWTYT